MDIAADDKFIGTEKKSASYLISYLGYLGMSYRGSTPRALKDKLGTT